MTDWIKCSERMPEKEGSYLTYGRYPWDPKMKKVSEHYFMGREFCSSGTFTHWMPLPEPPKEKEI